MKNKFLKISATAATTAVIASAFSIGVSAEETSFKDVPTSHPFFEEIEHLFVAKIIEGDSTGNFNPTSEVTRGQLAKMLVNALTLTADSKDYNSFKDVPSSHMFYEPISILSALNIAQGTTVETFNPDATVTREQAALFISRAIQISGTNSTQFEDVTTNTRAIDALYNAGITNGTSKTTFTPEKSVTRGEFAALLSRAMTFAENQPFTLSVLHVNDLHANVDKYPKLVTAVNEQKITKRDSLLLNAGDVFSGSLYFNAYQGEADMKILNSLDFDAMVFGNHEFDLGSSEEGHLALTKFVKGSNYPFLASNIDFSKDTLFNGLYSRSITSSPESGHIYNAIIKEVNGEKIGILGLTTEETKDIAYVGSVAFENYIEKAKESVAALEASGVNKIIALTHIGFDDSATVDNDQLLAKAVPGIDLIVGGHTHTQLAEPFTVATDIEGKEKDTTVIVQAYQYADFLGTVSLEFDANGVIKNIDSELITLSGYEADTDALAIINPYKAGVEEMSMTKTGVNSAYTLPNYRTSDPGYTSGSVRNSETALGNLITDGMLSQARKATPDKEIIMAVQNSGGIRNLLPEGDITVGDLIKVLPFGNTLATVEVTGQELIDSFEISFANAPSENGGFLQVSGAKVTYDSSKESKARVVKIEYLDGEGKYTEIDPAATYTIASNAFTIMGGDGYTTLRKAYDAGLARDFGTLDWENFRDYLLELGEITEKNTGIEERIIDLNN